MKKFSSFQNLGVDLQMQCRLQHHFPHQSHCILQKTPKKSNQEEPTFNHLPELWSHQTSSLAVPLPCHAFQSRPAPIPAFDSHQRNLLPAAASSLTVSAVLFIFLVSSGCSSEPPTYAQEPAANSVMTRCTWKLVEAGGGVVSLSV